jgi:hypothetical protein
MKLTRTFLAIVAAVLAVGLSPLPAAATGIPVPEPGTLSTLASAVVVGIIGYRFIRRR